MLPILDETLLELKGPKRFEESVGHCNHQLLLYSTAYSFSCGQLHQNWGNSFWFCV